MPDPALTTALKQAKSKKMFFAFIPKGTDGKLIVSKAKVPAKEVAEAKKEIGGGTPVTGKCFGEGGSMIFQVAKAAPSTMGPTLKKLIKRDTGLSMDTVIQMAKDADSEEVESKETASEGDAHTSSHDTHDAGSEDEGSEDESDDADSGHGGKPDAAGGKADAKGGAQGNILGLQKGLKKLGYDPGKIDGIMGPNTQGALKKFQQASGLPADGTLGSKTQAALAKALQGAGGAGPAKPAANGATPNATAANGRHAPGAGENAGAPGVHDLGPWQLARQNAITDLKLLATKVASTKHGSAAGVLKEIQSIIAKLPANPAPKDIDKLEDFIRHDDTITAAEEVPGHFHDLDIREPLLKALEMLRT